MPNPEKALLHAISMLAPNGKIVFLLTIHQNKNTIIDIIKHWFKYLTTIDFGRMTYMDSFLGLLD
jgi:tRNA A58 N-methylase Trm61